MMLVMGYEKGLLFGGGKRGGKGADNLNFNVMYNTYNRHVHVQFKSIQILGNESLATAFAPGSKQRNL